MKRLSIVGFCCWLAVAPIPATALMATNLELLTQAAELAVRDCLERVPLASGSDGWQTALLLEAQDEHEANWLVEQLLMEQLLAAGLRITTSEKGVDAAGPHLAYRIVDLGVTGRSRLLSGDIERSCRVTIGLRFSDKGELVALEEAKAELSDVIPGQQLDALQHSKHKFADTSLEKRSWERFAEPIIVTTILGSLIYLFFSNR